MRKPSGWDSDKKLEDVGSHRWALGGAEPIDGFSLINLSSSKPTTIMGSILNTVVISHVVEGAICEESRRRVSVYITLYCIL
jgi:hypothetical protein